MRTGYFGVVAFALLTLSLSSCGDQQAHLCSSGAREHTGCVCQDPMLWWKDVEVGEDPEADLKGGLHCLDQEQPILRCYLLQEKCSRSRALFGRRPKGASSRGVWGETENLWNAC
jgi:hypothetical protein